MGLDGGYLFLEVLRCWLRGDVTHQQQKTLSGIESSTQNCIMNGVAPLFVINADIALL